MPTPDPATPTAEVLTLLTALASAPATAVHVVSGRRADTWRPGSAGRGRGDVDGPGHGGARTLHRRLMRW
ncbi:MAG: hypothetical protein IPK26_07085 [Planctomycetes bacterium]|nr:hypothetical protein [Planctomycetota bacterium]